MKNNRVMKKLLMSIMLGFLVSAVSARGTGRTVSENRYSAQRLKPALALRVGADMTLLGMKFDYYNDLLDKTMSFAPAPFLGGTGYVGAAYEYPVSHNCAVAGGIGVSYGKALASQGRDAAFYSYFSMTSVHAEIYYALRLPHFYCNVGLRAGYMPLLVTEYRNGKNMFKGRMNGNHYTRGNVYGVIQLGYTTGRIDVGVDFSYALLSQFKEGFSYPVVGSYNVVRTMHMNVGLNFAYRFMFGK